MKAILFPGQGTQFKGMGLGLFKEYPKIVQQASELLGYSIEQLCLQDPGGRLRQTQFTQPALFVVNALRYYKMRDEAGPGFDPGWVAGHSLGEFNALLAAEVFDFEVGLKLVQRRGELMSTVDGAMAAVLGAAPDRVRGLLDEQGLNGVDLANFNAPTQVVIAGTVEGIAQALACFERQGIRAVQLNVSAPCHSHHMHEAQQRFSEYLAQFTYHPPRIPVVANASGRPYTADRIAEILGTQIASPVQWVDTVRYLMGKNVEFVEVGILNMLTKMVDAIKAAETPPAVNERPCAPSLR